MFSHFIIIFSLIPLVLRFWVVFETHLSEVVFVALQTVLPVWTNTNLSLFLDSFHPFQLAAIDQIKSVHSRAERAVQTLMILLLCC